jgi:hypothetical protein
MGAPLGMKLAARASPHILIHSTNRVWYLIPTEAAVLLTLLKNSSQEILRHELIIVSTVY